MAEMTTEEKARFDRMEQHIKEIQKDISNILSALVGTNVNGNKGLIHKVSDLEEEQIELKKEINHLKTENVKKQSIIDLLKWLLGGTIGSVITYFVMQTIIK